ncbi:MAG: hypothetical protein K0R38_6486 [Polyangiaceae bacterium]|jgi:hypothetical protein|nr:hypothetical protein [Polyangiaceae bacterium]
MRRRTSGSSVAVAVVVLGWAGPSTASPEAVQAELTCRPEAAPGRVLCELRYRAAAGHRLVWADAIVTRAPEFARPLRGRVTPERFKEAGLTERKLSLAFVATTSGVDKVTVLARAVACRGEGEQESCRPAREELTAELRVGS